MVFTTSGSLNLAGATSLGGFAGYGVGFIPGGSNWYIASGAGSSVDSYALTSFDGPFGTSTSFFTPPNSTSGDNFFIWGDSGLTAQVAVPAGYISGSAIASEMVFSGATIAGFTMIPGTYNYTIPNDNIVLKIGQTAIPEPTTLALLGTSLFGLTAFRRRRKATA